MASTTHTDGTHIVPALQPPFLLAKLACMGQTRARNTFDPSSLVHLLSLATATSSLVSAHLQSLSQDAH